MTAVVTWRPGGAGKLSAAGDQQNKDRDLLGYYQVPWALTATPPLGIKTPGKNRNSLNWSDNSREERLRPGWSEVILVTSAMFVLGHYSHDPVKEVTGSHCARARLARKLLDGTSKFIMEESG